MRLPDKLLLETSDGGLKMKHKKLALLLSLNLIVNLISLFTYYMIAEFNWLTFYNVLTMTYSCVGLGVISFLNLQTDKEEHERDSNLMLDNTEV